ncbi:hypothetical protein Dimus_006368 [Dionaea muscipula]
MQALIKGTIEDTIGNKDDEGNTSNLVEEEMRGFMLAAAGGMNHHRFLEPGDTGDIEKVGGELVAYDRAQEGRHGSQQPLGIVSGPIFNMEGINLEVVFSPIVGLSNHGLNNMGSDLEAQHISWDNINNAAMAKRMGEVGEAQLHENTGPRLHYQGNSLRRSQGAALTEHIIEEDWWDFRMVKPLGMWGSAMSSRLRLGFQEVGMYGLKVPLIPPLYCAQGGGRGWGGFDGVTRVVCLGVYLLVRGQAGAADY